MSYGSGGHITAGERTKISYATEEAAKESARRRFEELGVPFHVYDCRLVRPNSVHPVLRATHFHITSEKPRKRPPHERGHEAFDLELGRRVVGCMLAENKNGPERRLHVVTQRWAGIERRRVRVAA